MAKKKKKKEKKTIKKRKPKEKYFLEIMVGEPPKIYKYDTNNVMETLLHSGIDPISIEFWTTIRLTNRETKKTFHETLNVPKMRNCLTNDSMALYVATNLITMTE